MFCAGVSSLDMGDAVVGLEREAATERAVSAHGSCTIGRKGNVW